MGNLGRVVLIVFFFGLTLGGLFTAVEAKDGFDVLCYVFEGGDYEYVDNIDTFNLRDAAARCNTEYEDCKQRCIGCYLDDEGTEICFDNSGKRFEK